MTIDLNTFTALVNKIPLNSMGMPEGIYRPDLLPPTELLKLAVHQTPTPQTSQQLLPVPSGSQSVQHTQPQSQQPQVLTLSDQMLHQQKLIEAEQELAAAYVPLQYYEGFPTMDGRPFWAPLPFEPTHALKAFETFLSLKPSQRTLFNVSSADYDMYELNQYFHLYYWSQRARAFDLFYAVVRKRERNTLAATVEDENYKLACRLADLADDYLDQYGDEFLEMMTPKTLLELVKTAATLQRISVGLPANGASPTHIEHLDGMSLQQIAQRTVDRNNIPVDKLLTNNGDTNINISTQNTQNNQILSNLMNDPAALALAQELIIRMSGGDPNKTFDQRHAIHADSVAKDIGISTKQVIDLEAQAVETENNPA